MRPPSLTIAFGILALASGALWTGHTLTRVGSPVPPAAANGPDSAPITITVLWTTDFHGAIRGREREGRPIGSTPVLAAYIARERARNPERTFLLDGGDAMQGSMPSNLSFGRAVIEQMNRLEYDAAAIGNHEFDWSAETLAARVRQSSFPWLGANIVERASGRRPPWASESVLLERGGVRVGVIGFATVTTPNVTMPSHVAPYRFAAPARIARRAIAELRERGADVVLVVGHLPAAVGPRGGEPIGELAELGRAVEDEDALLGGHQHIFVEAEVDSVPLLLAGSHGRALGRVDFTLDPRTRRVRDHSARLIYTYADEIEPDPYFAALTDSLTVALRPIAERVVGRADAPLRRDRRRESLLGNWVTDAMREAAAADVALHNAGGLRADLRAGPVTVEDVYEVMPFDNRIVTLRLTGAALLDAVEHGLRDQDALQVSGIGYRYDPDRPEGERVVALTVTSGAAIDPRRSYRVVTNEFLAEGGDGYWMIAKGSDKRVEERLVRDVLIADAERRLARDRSLPARPDGRIVRIDAARSPAFR